MKPSDKLLYRKREAAQIIGVSVRTLEYRIARGEIKTIHKGKLVRIHRRELEKWAVIDEDKLPVVA